jgi:hypothetical protein
MDTSDTDITGRDARVIWKTVTVVAVIVATVISGLVTAVAWAVRHDARLESVEKWQAAKDRDASRELWRRDFDRNSHPISPGVTR